MNKISRCLLFTLVVFRLTGCTSTNLPAGSGINGTDVHTKGIDAPDDGMLLDTVDLFLKMVGEPAEGTEEGYVLEVGDVLDIKFYYSPELNETVRIRPDGKISLQLIDEVAAAGLIPSRLDRILTEKYSKVLRRPDIVVIVREYADRRVYVGGEVNAAGLVPISGKLTALQAILQAGGYKDTAELKNVVILRDQGTQDPLFVTLNLKNDLRTRTSSNDVLLKPYDIVFVPKTPIAKLGQFVRQYVHEIVPVTVSLGLIYNLNPELQVSQ